MIVKVVVAVGSSPLDLSAQGLETMVSKKYISTYIFLWVFGLAFLNILIRECSGALSFYL
jgi:hypothetical protein